jgi:hypothetical protein
MDSFLALSKAQREVFILGPIERVNGGYNYNWHWQFRDNQWIMVEMAIELCDGVPSYVDEHLDEWLESVTTFCPWESRLDRELFPGEQI